MPLTEWLLVRVPCAEKGWEPQVSYVCMHVCMCVCIYAIVCMYTSRHLMLHVLTTSQNSCLCQKDVVVRTASLKPMRTQQNSPAMTSTDLLDGPQHITWGWTPLLLKPSGRVSLTFRKRYASCTATTVFPVPGGPWINENGWVMEYLMAFLWVTFATFCPGTSLSCHRFTISR